MSRLAHSHTIAIKQIATLLNRNRAHQLRTHITPNNQHERDRLFFVEKVTNFELTNKLTCLTTE